MSLARKHNFISGSPIFAEDWIDELEQIYQFFKGSISDVIVLNQNSANLVLIVVNTSGSREVITLKKGTNTLLSILANQQFNSLITDNEPINVQSTTKVVGLNASYLDNIPLSGFVLAGLKQTEFAVPLIVDHFIPDVVTFKAPVFIVPAGASMQLISVEFSAVINIPGSTLQVSLRKNGSILTGTTFDRTGGFSANLGTSVVENDVISFTIDDVVLDEGQMYSFTSANIKFRQALSA